MILYELLGSEEHKDYKELEISNGNRQYDFLRSIVTTANSLQRTFLSTQVLKSLNFHAITCLHTNAGEYRPCPVTVGEYEPPAHYSVPALMDDCVNSVNAAWNQADPVALASFVLWRLNSIHPFINGNGRTARAACYFVLCVKTGSWLPGTTILPELIRRERPRYIEILKETDESSRKGTLDMTLLHAFLSELLEEQIGSSEPQKKDS